MNPRYFWSAWLLMWSPLGMAQAPEAGAEEPAPPDAPVALPEQDEEEEDASPSAACAAWSQLAPGQHRGCYVSSSGDFSVATFGHDRMIVDMYPDFPVDARGTVVGQQGAVLSHRLRLGLGASYKWLQLATEWDLFTGQIAGDVWDIPGEEDARRRWALDGVTPSSFVPRRASLKAVVPDPWGTRVPLAIIEGGLMPANRWGLGLLANGGEQETLFGRVDGGDRMARFRVTTAPFRVYGMRIPLFLTLGFDQVIEDDTASLARGQKAYHFISSLLYRGDRGAALGLFFTWRSQTEDDVVPRPTRVGVVDLYGKLPVSLGPSGWRLELSMEDVVVLGRTQRVLTYAVPERTRVFSAAAAVEAAFVHPDELVTAHIRSGFTSATGDPDAGEIQDFTLDRNYNVGMVLFDEVLGATAAGAYALLQDPTLVGEPPPGADGLVHEGAVQRAAWIWPAVEVHPLGWFDLRAGYLAAWSTGPIAQSFYTARQGGVPHNHLNERTDDRFLGHEVQFGVGFGRGTRVRDWPARPKLWLEGAHAWAGEGLGGGRHLLLRGTLQVDW